MSLRDKVEFLPIELLRPRYRLCKQRQGTGRSLTTVIGRKGRANVRRPNEVEIELTVQGGIIANHHRAHNLPTSSGVIDSQISVINDKDQTTPIQCSVPQSDDARKQKNPDAIHRRTAADFDRGSRVVDERHLRRIGSPVTMSPRRDTGSDMERTRT